MSKKADTLADEEVVDSPQQDVYQTPEEEDANRAKSEKASTAVAVSPRFSSDEMEQLGRFIQAKVHDALDSRGVPAEKREAPVEVWQRVGIDHSAYCPTCRFPETVWIKHHDGGRAPDETRRGCSNV